MHFEPDVIRRIDRTALRDNDYFSSLLEQAWGQQMLGMHDMERIRYECLALLAEKTRHFTAGDSSSIPTDTAKELLRSMYFTIGLCLKDYSNFVLILHYLFHKEYSNYKKDMLPLLVYPLLLDLLLLYSHHLYTYDQYKHLLNIFQLLIVLSYL